MGIYDKTKNVFKYTKKKLMPSKRVLLCCSAALFFFLVLAAAIVHYVLPMEARSGEDFNLRSIYPLTSYAHRGENVPLKFNVFTHSPGLYELKVYSPGGELVFKSLKPVRKNNLGVWTVISEVEAREFGRYEVELFGLFNKNGNQLYRTSFWMEELSLSENSSTPIEELGSLYINSIPIGSTVYLNGHDIGATPFTIDSLPVGNYSLILALDGYETFETKVDILAGKTTSVYQPLAKIQPSDDMKKPLITALHIKAFIIFLIAGFFVYVIIEVLLKDENKVR